MNADRIAIMISSCVGHARLWLASTNWDLRAEWPNETTPGPRGNDGTNLALSPSVWSGRGHSGTVRYLKKTVDQEVRGSAEALEPDYNFHTEYCGPISCLAWNDCVCVCVLDVREDAGCLACTVGSAPLQTCHDGAARRCLAHP